MKRVLVALGVILLAGAAWSVRAPESAAFRAWQDENRPHFGRIPSPVDRSYLPAAYRAWREKKASAAAGRRMLRAAASLPAKWDARDQGWVTPVKDQGYYGTCWAHAALGQVETTLLKTGRGEWDLSENHMARHDVGFLPDYTAEERFDAGGTPDISAALLLSWRDPLTEEQDPYADPDSGVTGDAAFHLQRLVWIPARTNALDNTVLKEALMTYGALDVGMYVAVIQIGDYAYTDTSYFNSSAGAYYCSQTNYSNHAVLLVGWDDSYPAANFSKTPPGDGAFLIRNSWGTDDERTTNGYNWVSYYDASFCNEAAAAYSQMETPNNYGRIYQYDPCGQTEMYNAAEIGETMDGKSNWCANVFSSVATGIVSAVGFHSMAPGLEYTVRVYANVTGTAPNSGTLMCEQSGTVDFAGYVTVPLVQEVPITMAGERFAVVMRMDAPGVEYPIPVEQSISNYYGIENTCTAHAGESYYSTDGNTWKDFQQFNQTANVCIKAYTRFGADGDIPGDLIDAVSPSAEEGVGLHAGRDTGTFAVTLVSDETPTETVWLLDGVQVGTGNTWLYAPTTADHGVHRLVCRAVQGTAMDERSWTVTVSVDIPVSGYTALTNTLYGGVVEGDRVIVAPGVYADGIIGPSVRVEIIAAEGPETTVLERGTTTCCYYGGYNTETLIAGFTLRNGNCQRGGGISYGSASNCVIENCVANYGGGAYQACLYGCTIRNCTAYNDGGGAADSSLLNCVISNCVSYAGGGASYSELVNCLVVSNVANDCSWYDRWGRLCYQEGLGGGAYESTICNCTLATNHARGYGGGAYLQNYGGAFNTVVAENTSAFGYGYGNDVYGNLYFSMENSISANDPAECHVKFVDSARGDWRLAAGSPCIDAGENSYVLEGDTDLDGAARIFGAAVDIGCYEYAHVAPGWPVPEVSAGATAAEESEAVGVALESAGFPPNVASNVTTLAEYNTINAWSEEKGVSVAELAASGTALLSPALGADGVLELTSEDLAVTNLTVSTSSGGGVSFMLSLAAYDVAKADPALLAAAVGVEGTETLGTGFSSDGLDVVVTPGEEGIAVTVAPPAAKSTYFLRTLVR